MADIYSPWMASSEEDVTSMGLVTPEYMEMYAEAQAGPGSEASIELETTPEIESSEPEDAMKQHMQMALETINKQSEIINQLMALLKQ